jgi:hypothetical protein
LVQESSCPEKGKLAVSRFLSYTIYLFREVKDGSQHCKPYFFRNTVTFFIANPYVNHL